MLEKTLKNPLDCKIKMANPKKKKKEKINPEYSLEGLTLNLKLQYFGHLLWRDDCLEKIPVMGRNVNRTGSRGSLQGCKAPAFKEEHLEWAADTTQQFFHTEAWRGNKGNSAVRYSHVDYIS